MIDVFKEELGFDDYTPAVAKAWSKLIDFVLDELREGFSDLSPYNPANFEEVIKSISAYPVS